MHLSPMSVDSPGVREEPAGTETAGFKVAARSQASLLAPAERACLSWLVRHMPSWVKPDHLTLVGFAAMFMVGTSYALARWWPPFLLAASFWLAVNWFGDSLDGTLARARNKQRPRYGFYVDHMVDAFGSLFLVTGLALSGYMTPMMAMALLVSYSILSINVYLASYTIGTFKLSFYRISPTELRVLIAAGNLIALVKPTTHMLGRPLLFFDVAAGVATGVIAIVTIISVSRNTTLLYREEKV